MKIGRLIIIMLVAGLIVMSNHSIAQETKYYPKGDPEQLNIAFSPYLWLPAISGEIVSEMVSEDFNAPAVDLLSNLRFAFMFGADVSKGKFFTSLNYFYAKLGADKVLKTDNNGDPAIVSHPDLQMNIFELVAGMRFDSNQEFYFDPYLGFRYTNYRVNNRVEGVMDTTNIEESFDYWDPVLGFKFHYYPHPRVPLTLKTDVGGFGAGSKFSWTASFQGGYTLSPTVDLFAGINAYGSNFEKENKFGNNVGLNLTMYGIDFGVRIMIPARYKDTAIFKKTKKN